MAAAPKLEELELALNEVTPDGAKELAVALANKSNLQKLNLRENELEDRGVILLSGPIQSLPALCILDLAQNQVCFLNTCCHFVSDWQVSHSVCSYVHKALHHVAASAKSQKTYPFLL